jgi:hypothetical protein
MMATIAEWIEEMAEGEPVEAVVIGRFAGASSKQEPFVGVLLAWKDARQHLLYEFDWGYGAPRCHPVLAWTRSWIIGIREYDGSTSQSRVPRHPTACTPFWMGQM